MGCVQCVPEQRIAVVERFGKFDSMAHPGCLCLPIPCICTLAGMVNLQVQQLNVRIETKSLDNVFVTIVVAVQFQPIPEKVYESFYRLSNPKNQINSFVFDVVRSSVPKMELDELFLNKEKIANDVESQLSQLMFEYGFRIRDVLVIDIDPEDKVKYAMNEINANRRLRIAAQEKAEADKIMVVKKAEAEAESKYLHGRGVARQRQAIVEGLQTSVADFTEDKELAPKDILELLLITQHFDMIEHVGTHAHESTLFLSHNPGSIINTSDQIRAMLSAGSSAGLSSVASLSSGAAAYLPRR
jgi:regulator of protease activity HflC (stomatin/prohibitin superfamily)